MKKKEHRRSVDNNNNNKSQEITMNINICSRKYTMAPVSVYCYIAAKQRGCSQSVLY